MWTLGFSRYRNEASSALNRSTKLPPGLRGVGYSTAVALIAGSAPAAAQTVLVRARMRTLPARYRPEPGDGFAAELHLSVEDLSFRISIAGRRCTVAEERPAFPTARISTDVETWLRLDDGSLSSIEAFLQGRVVVRGNTDHAVRMQSLFRPSTGGPVRPGIQHVAVPAGEHSLSTYQLGEGPPVMLLHGLGATKLSWLPLLPPLAERFRVIVPDLPGHGDSSKPRASYSPRFYAGVVRRLLDAVGVERAVLAGNSMGGRVALEVAIGDPGRVAGLALVAPAVAGLPFPSYSRLLGMVPTQLAALPLPLRRRVVSRTIRQLFADPRRLPGNAYLAGVDEFIRVYRSGRARMALLSATRGLMRDRSDLFWKAVRRVEVPTLILHGERDRLVPLRMVRALASSLPRGELAVLPGVGHVPQFEVPDTTAGLVRSFLDEVYPAGARRRIRKHAPRGVFSS
jgi:pimeloyl-ACP methyl ester carboxylesterase